MALSYAGIPLPVLTRKTAARLERKIRVEDLYPWDYVLSGDGRMGYTQAAERIRNSPPRLGCLFWPSGASRWAHAFFLVSSAKLQAIRQVVYSGSYQPANLILSDNERQITAKMWMLPAHPLEVDASRAGLWLLVLVDQRYFWWLNRTGNLSVSGNTAWPTLYQTYANLLPGSPSIQVDSIPSAYQSAPGTFSATDEQIPPLLDSVAKSVGQRIVCGLDGSVYAYGYSTSERLRKANLAKGYPVLAGSEMQLGAQQDTPGYFPKTVRVDFPQTQTGSLIGSVASVSVDFSALGILPGCQTNADTTALYHPFQATLDASSVWTNQAACQALAKQYATDFYYYQTSPEDIMLAGIADWQPDGLEDWIEWTYTRDMVSTRVQRAPQNHGDLPPLATGTIGGPGSGGGGGGTVIYNNYTFNYGTDTWNIVNNTFNYDSLTVINYTSTTVNITANTTWNLYSSSTWTIQGGNINTSIYELNNLTIDFATVSVEITANQTWIVSPGVNWTISSTTGSLILSIPVSIAVDETWTIQPGITWTITGDNTTIWQLNCLIVDIGIGALWTWPDTTNLKFTAGNLGDIPYIDNNKELHRLAANASPLMGFLTETGASAPQWFLVSGNSSDVLHGDGTWSPAGSGGNANISVLKKTITWSGGTGDFKLTAAATSQTFTLLSPGSNVVIQKVYQLLSTDFSGGGSTGTSTQFKNSSGTTYGSTNPIGPVAATGGSTIGVTDALINFNATGQSLQVTVNVTGANCSALTAGSVTYWIEYLQLP